MEIKSREDLVNLFYKYKQRILFAGSDFKYSSYKGENTLNAKWTCMAFVDEKTCDCVEEADRSINYVTNPDKFLFSFTQKKPAVISLGAKNSNEDLRNYSKTTEKYFNVIKNANNSISLFCIAGVTSEGLEQNSYDKIALKKFINMLDGTNPELQNAMIILFQYDEIKYFCIDESTEFTVEQLCKEFEERNTNINIIKLNSRIEDLFDYIPDDEYDEYTEFDEYSDSIDFYIDDKLKSIDKTIVNYATDTILLNDELVYAEVDKIKKYNISKYFYKFLRDSYRTPIWYGYSKDFYIERECDHEIIEHVKNALKKHDNTEINKPICIYGSSGSGKTLTAGYIAYEIYKTYEYPVLYINKSKTNFNTHGDMFFVDSLKKLLNEIENKGNNPCLIVLDTSGYERANIDSLFKTLKNGAKKFVLICTLYQDPNNIKSNEYKENIEEINIYGDLSRIIYKSYKIGKKLSNEGNVKELNDLERKLNKYAKFSKDESLDMVALANRGENFLASMYWMFNEDSSIRNSLFGGVKSEAESAVKYLKKITENSESETVDFSKLILNTFQEQLEKNNIIEFLNLCAVCQKFRKMLPHRIAAPRIGFTDLDDAQIPFFEQFIDDDGEWYVGIRSEIQARIWLEANNINAEQEINIICNLIDSVQPEEVDGGLEIKFVDDFLRSISINAAKSSKSHRTELSTYIEYYYKIIDSLYKRNKTYKEKRLMCQEIIFSREYYKHTTDNEVKKDYDKIDYLDNNFSETNNNDLTGNIGQYISVLVKNIKTGEKLLETSEPKDISIMGEICCAYLYILRYQKNCGLSMNGGSARPNEIEDEYPHIGGSYRSYVENCNLLLKHSSEMLKLQPNNSYANSYYLWGLGMKYRGAEHSGDFEEMAEIMSEICIKIEEIISENYAINTYENSQQSDNFDDEGENYVFTVGMKLLDIIRNNQIADKWFDKLIEDKKPYGLILKSTQKLIENNMTYRNIKNKGLDNSDEYNEDEKQGIRDIYIEYFENHMEIAKNNLACLYDIVKIKWILYTNESVFGNFMHNIDSDPGVVKMNQEQWKEILDFCECYCEKRKIQSEDNIDSRDRNMYYLYALCCFEMGLVFDRKRGAEDVRNDDNWIGKAFKAIRTCSKSELYGNRAYRSIYYICREDGTKKEFNMKKYDNFDLNENTGKYRSSGIYIPDVDKQIYYHKKNINNVEQLNDRSKIQLALGYRGLSVFRKGE